MAAFFGNLRNVVIASFVLAILLVGVYCATQGFDGPAFELFVLRWLHITCGVMWIGLLWYFNFVQIPTMPKVPDELKKGVTGYIAPQALFWFRWAALATWLGGAWLLGPKFVGAFTLGAGLDDPTHYYLIIGIGAWLGTIMLLNVWGVIWRMQKKILGIVPATDEEKAKARRVALLASRTNFVLSIPMLMCMASASHGLPFLPP